MSTWPRINPPAVPGADPATDTPPRHTHPLPRWLRLALFGYALGLLIALGGAAYVWHLEQGAVRDRARAIEQELDRRTAARNQMDAARQVQFNRLVCDVIAGDLTPSARTKALAAGLKCPAED